MAGMTDKESAFVNEYCSNGFNATQAALTAGYSKASARQLAHKVLSKDYIQDSIQAYMAKLQDEALCTTADIVRGLLRESNPDSEDTTPAARVSALKALTDYTGGFDNNQQTIKSTVTVKKADNVEW